MLTSLDFFQKGKPWPIEDKDEKARLQEHYRNRQLYNESHEVIFEKYKAYLQDKHEDDKKIAILFGWAETATDSYLNLLLGEEPDIEAPVKYDLPNDEVFTDVSRYGIGLYEVSQDGISAQNPESCYIILTPGNIRKVQAYVFFQEFAEGTVKYVKLTVHLAGAIQHLIYEIRNGKLESTRPLNKFKQFENLKVDVEGKQSTGVAELLVVQVNNKLTSDSYYGQSDYSPAVHSIIEALELAFARRAEVLAKFTRPKPMAPLNAFRFNHAKQKWIFKTEEAIIVEPGDPPAQYLTWQAQLGDVEVEIQDLMDQLLMKLKLSKILLAGKDAGTADSGTALRIRLIPSLSKVRKFASALKKVVPAVLSLKSKLDDALKAPDAKAYEPSDVQIEIYDGIPDDPTEAANVNSIKAGTLAALKNARILSGKAALRIAFEQGILDVPAEMSLEEAVLQISNEAADEVL